MGSDARMPIQWIFALSLFLGEGGFLVVGLKPKQWMFGF
jgi:hypothetical protein